MPFYPQIESSYKKTITSRSPLNIAEPQSPLQCRHSSGSAEPRLPPGARCCGFNLHPQLSPLTAASVGKGLIELHGAACRTAVSSQTRPSTQSLCSREGTEVQSPRWEGRLPRRREEVLWSDVAQSPGADSWGARGSPSRAGPSPGAGNPAKAGASAGGVGP